jgi:hypothetical protein
VIAEQLLDLHPGTCKLLEDLVVIALRHLRYHYDIFGSLVFFVFMKSIHSLDGVRRYWHTHTASRVLFTSNANPAFNRRCARHQKKGTCQNSSSASRLLCNTPSGTSNSHYPGSQIALLTCADNPLHFAMGPGLLQMNSEKVKSHVPPPGRQLHLGN